MLPVVDAFRKAPLQVPAAEGEGEKGENMHKSFVSLLGSLLGVFEKYGFKEFAAGDLSVFTLLFL